MAQIIAEMLDVSPGGIPPIIHLSQYDKLTRTIVFNLIDDTGTYAIPSGAIATVRGTKPDKTGFEYEGIISGNTVTVNVQDQMTVCAGRIPCEIRISGFDGSVLGTANFLLDIEPAALLDNTTISETELPLIERATEAVAPTLAAAKEAKTYASEASGYATQSKNSAAAASSSASEASSYAAQTKANAENAADSAKSAGESATKAAEYAGAVEYSIGINPKTGHMAIFYNKQS